MVLGGALEALFWANRSIGAPVRSVLRHDEHILSTALYGSMWKEAYYYVNVFVGSPPKKQSVILDTGSSVLAFPCKGCNACGKHVNAPYAISDSTTARWVACGEDKCFSERCSSDNSFKHCDYFQAYSEGSSISGHYFSDLISITSFQDSEDQNQLPVTYESQLTSRYDHIGCHLLETKLFVGQTANGILGVAFPHKNQPTAMDALFRSSPHYKDSASEQINTPKRIFSICISEQGGILTMGGYDPNYINIIPYTDPFIKNKGPVSPIADEEDPSHEMERMDELILETEFSSKQSYTIAASGMSYVGGPLGPDGSPQTMRGQLYTTIIDSGTTYSYLAPEIYTSLAKVIIESCEKNANCNRDGVPMTNIADTCYLVQGTDRAEILEELDAAFPTFRIHVTDPHGTPTVIFPWQPRSYMYLRSGSKWCTAIDNNHMNETVFGMSFIKNRMAIFDREHGTFGLLPGTCPTMTDTVRDEQKGPILNASSLITVPDDQHQAIRVEEERTVTDGVNYVMAHYKKARDTAGAEDWHFWFGSTLVGTVVLIWYLKRRFSSGNEYAPQRDGSIRQPPASGGLQGIELQADPPSSPSSRRTRETVTGQDQSLLSNGNQEG